MLSVFSAMFSSVKHDTFLFALQLKCQTCSRNLSHPGTVNHIRVHIPKSAVCQCDTKGIFIELRRQPREYNFLTTSSKIAHVLWDNGLLLALFF